MRPMLESPLNAVMDEQASGLGAQRNGCRERSLDTCVGRVTLRVPKLREGTCFPSDIVERWSRIDTALASAIRESWVAGVSTRKMERAASGLGCERQSRSRVSGLCASLDAEVDEMRGCDLSGSEWPCLWLDAAYVPCREAGAARSCALVTAVACDLTATRRVVGVERVDTESHQSWRSFLLSLRSRGLSGVRLVVSDAREGLARAVREVMCGAAWQRCIARLERNVTERCARKGDGAGAELLEAAEAAALSYLDFPRERRVRIRPHAGGVVLKKGAHIPCAPCPGPGAISAHKVLTEHNARKVARIPDDDGWRANGRGRGSPRGADTACLRAAVDDRSRVAYAEPLPDERKATTCCFIARVLAWGSEAERAAALPAFIERYNWDRPHSACGGLPPTSRIAGVNNVLAHNI